MRLFEVYLEKRDGRSLIAEDVAIGVWYVPHVTRIIPSQA